jgi:hypothetical protein
MRRRQEEREREGRRAGEALRETYQRCFCQPFVLPHLQAGAEVGHLCLGLAQRAVEHVALVQQHLGRERRRGAASEAGSEVARSGEGL